MGADGTGLEAVMNSLRSGLLMRNFLLGNLDLGEW
jgi:hypothetical protein